MKYTISLFFIFASPAFADWSCSAGCNPKGNPLRISDLNESPYTYVVAYAATAKVAFENLIRQCNGSLYNGAITPSENAPQRSTIHLTNATLINSCVKE